MADESETNRQLIFRRILVAVDPSSHSRAALEAAAELAQKLEGKIHGLFVQEETWHKVGQLPSVISVNELTGRTSTLEKEFLEEQIKRLKKRLQRQVKTISRKNKISHSWETVRGRVEKEILRAAEDADLITIGRRGSSFPEKQQLGSSAKKIIYNANKPVLILKKGLQLGNPITAVYDGTEESRRCIKLALSLAEKFDTRLTILAMRNIPDAERSRSSALENMVDTTSPRLKVLLLKNPDLWGFVHSINRRNSGLLIIPKSQPILKKSLEKVLYQLNCPLLMMN